MKLSPWLCALSIAQAGFLAGCASQPVDAKSKVTTIKVGNPGDFANAQEPEIQALLVKTGRTTPSDRQAGYLAAMVTTMYAGGPPCEELRLLDIRIATVTAGQDGRETWVFNACGAVREAEIRRAVGQPASSPKQPG